MKCPFCNLSDSSVLESRLVENDEALRRRRKCLKCQRRFTTYERVKRLDLWVIKKDGRREPFNREKVRQGILLAIRKRPVSLELVEGIVSRVEREMIKKEISEVPTRAIGGAILRKLKRIDKVAWLRFASVYLEFEDLKDFEEVIKE